MTRKVTEKKPKRGQKRKLSICPRCGRRFYYWQYAAKHAKYERHWGNYNP